MFISKSLIALAVITKVYAATSTSSGYLPQISPVFPIEIPVPSGVVTFYNSGPYVNASTLDTSSLSGFPTIWKVPSTTTDEVQTVYKSLNWSMVPKAPVRTIKSNKSFRPSTDGSGDPYCYWSATNCVHPKVSYLPSDLYECPTKGQWGLTYDDGPFNKVSTDEDYASKENRYAEPALYNFLGQNNIHASLFYIGSNVVSYPAAAKLALNNGNSLCVHTWSHTPMTTLTNAEIVAELYWSIKAIKTATGVTPKCWRPPQGDVDDRVRSIAWQMGLQNVLWNEDTDDWDMPDEMNGGSLPTKTVDGYFQKWIDAQKAGKLDAGILVLEHELNRVTVNMSIHWLPIIQKTFNVVSALSCNGISQPYWETGFVYPIDENSSTQTTTTTEATTTMSTKTASTTSITSSTNTANSSTKTTTTLTTSSPIKTTSSTKSSTKTTTKTSATTTTSACTAGSKGNKNGDGAAGACCSTSEDCVETCRKGVCGL